MYRLMKHQTSAFVMYYSKCDRKVNAFIKVLTEWSLKKQRGRPVGNSQKCLWSLTGAVADESF